MFLPCSLHVDPLAVIQCHGGDKIFRQVLILLYIVLLHIIFHDLGINFIIDICAVERFRLAHIIIGVDRLDPPGDPQHGQFSGLLCGIDLEIRRLHYLPDITHRISPLLFCQKSRGCNGCIRHGESDPVAHGYGFLLSVSKPQLDQSVCQSHDPQTDLPPLPDTFSLFFQRMERQALIQDFIQSFHCSLSSRTSFKAFTAAFTQAFSPSKSK